MWYTLGIQSIHVAPAEAKLDGQKDKPIMTDKVINM